MKRIISNVMLIAAAAMTFFGCQKPEAMVSATAEEVVLTFASEKPVLEDETKTEWTGETIQWSKGDKISVAYTVDGNWQNAKGNASGDAKLYKSDALTESASVAQFNVSAYFEGTTEGTHVFYGVYPAPSETGFANAPVATVTVASNQNPKADSFDANGDLMVGVSGEYSSRPGDGETISLRWNRLVAHAVITLKNINGFTAGETIEIITLTAQKDANLVGQQQVNLITKEVVKDNDDANVLKLAAGNLKVTDGTVSFWSCFLPETITSLTIAVETDKATYTREIESCNLEFKQNARNTLAIKMGNAVRVEKTVASDEVVDVLNRALTGITGTTYSSWSGKTSASTAVYAGQSAGGNESIQLRSNNSNSGIVTTASGGYVKSVSVTWNSNTSSGRTLSVYGKSSAYTAPTDLYSSNTQGTLLGTIVCGTSTELVIDGDYEYIGMRSNSGAMYLQEIKVTWASGSTDSPEVPDAAPSVELEVEELELTAEAEEGTIEVVTKNIASIQVRALVEEGAQEESGWLVAEYDEENSCVTYSADANESEEERTAYIEVYALDAEGNEIVAGVNVTQAGYVDSSVIATLTVEDFLSAAVSSDVWYQLTGTISNITNTSYGNFDLTDESGTVYVYGLKENETADKQTFANLGLKEGDIVTLIGNRAEYSSKAQVGNAYYVSHIASAASPEITVEDNTVSISAASGAKIYYTTDGSEPTVESSVYTGSFKIEKDTVVKAFAVESGKPNSIVVTLTCVYVNPDADEPETVEASLSFANKAQRTTYTTSQQVWEQNGIKLTNDKASSSNNVADYANPARFYAGSKLTVEAPGSITKILFDCNSSSYATAMKNSIGTVSGATVSISSDKVTVTFSTAVESFVVAKLTAQVRMDALTVTYTD